MTRLADLTYPEAQQRLQDGAIALWPIGSTEAHGPHLPLDTDVLISSETCRRAIEPLAASGVDALILPPLSFTLTDCAAPFAGTLSIPKSTVQPYVRDVIASACQQGFRLVCLVNAHLEPAHRYLLRDAVSEANEAGASATLADPADRRFVDRLSDEFKSGACHAGQYESSLVLAAHGRVDETQRSQLAVNDVDILSKLKAGARDFQQMGAEQAYFGDPAAASIEEGNATYAVLVDIVTAVVQEALT